jgi:hypothetical protein
MLSILHNNQDETNASADGTCFTEGQEEACVRQKEAPFLPLSHKRSLKLDGAGAVTMTVLYYARPLGASISPVYCLRGLNSHKKRALRPTYPRTTPMTTMTMEWVSRNGPVRGVHRVGINFCYYPLHIQTGSYFFFSLDSGGQRACTPQRLGGC